MTAYLTPTQVAAHYNIAVKTLYNWRLAGVGPEAVKVGRLLRYTPEAITAFDRKLNLKAAS